MIRKNEDIRIVRTKKSLKSAFISLLERIPYAKISIIDICDEAKVHRATFYNYYRSKEDLFSCIIEDSKDAFVQKMKDEGVTVVEPSEEVLAGFKEKAQPFYEMGADFGWSDGLYDTVKKAMGAE